MPPEEPLLGDRFSWFDRAEAKEEADSAPEGGEGEMAIGVIPEAANEFGEAAPSRLAGLEDDDQGRRPPAPPPEDREALMRTGDGRLDLPARPRSLGGRSVGVVPLSTVVEVILLSPSALEYLRR